MAEAFSLPPGFGGAAMGPLPAYQMSQTNKPRHTRVDKKVSWAPEDSLCQVRLFAPDDTPAQSSTVRQDLLQAKEARFLHALNPIMSVDMPPGFGPSAPKRMEPIVASIMPQISWRTPEPFKLEPTWQVMAGGASAEVSVQKQRENRILEAVYPRPSAIPDSPAEPSESQLPYDEAKTLMIPVVPLEDDDSPDPDDLPTSSDSIHEALSEIAVSGEKRLSPPPGFAAIPVKSRNWWPEAPQDSGTLGVPRDSIIPSSTITSQMGPPVSMSRNVSSLKSIPVQSPSVPNAHLGSSVQPPTRANEAEPDVVAATAAAYAALSQSNDATMIDRDLLIQFLTNPSMLQTLSEKLAANPPGNERRSNDSVEQHAGPGPRGNPRLWNPIASEHIRADLIFKGGQRHSETAAVAADASTNHGYDKPPGFGPPPSSNGPSTFTGTFDSRPTNRITQALHRPPIGPPPQPGQRFAPPRPANGQYVAPSNSPPRLPAAQPGASGPVLQRDEQYYKDLISQHGRKDAEDSWVGVSAMESGNNYQSSGRPRTTIVERDRKLERSERSERLDSEGRWLGREEMDLAGLSIRQGDNESGSGQSRGKSRKACIYFSTSRGCRNGSSCAFVHETNNVERAKRPRLEGKESSKGYR